MPKSRKSLSVLALAVSACALPIAGGGAIAVDGISTSYALNKGQEETNPILGPRPSSARLAAYNVAAIGLYSLVEWRLKPAPRKWVAAGVLILEGVLAVRNVAMAQGRTH